MTWTSVTSSNLDAIRHDAKAAELHVRFKRKDASDPETIFIYHPVSADEVKSLLSAPSIGKHFHTHIKSHPHKTARKAS